MKATNARYGGWIFGTLLASGCYEPSFPDTPGSACEEASQALADEIYAAPQGCTAVLDLDDGFAIRQWTLVCAPDGDGTLTESQARRLTECCEDQGTVVNPPEPDDAFVFFDTDADDNGTVAVVSRHTASRVYEATLTAGEPDVVFPRANDWRGLDELASDCDPAEIDAVRSYDDNGDAAPAAVLDVLTQAEATGLVDAMRSGDGELLWTVVVRAGAGSPRNGGWIALLQSSSLGIDFTSG